MTLKPIHAGAVILCGVLAASLNAQPPIGVAFTYQGRLTDMGGPANGQYDFAFKLFDALSAGSQVGDTIYVEDHPVSQGLFTAQLDFGAGAFSGAARWLEIGVRPGASTEAHTLLNPRQAVTAAPYALGLVLPFAAEASLAFAFPPSPLFSITATGPGPALTAAFYATSPSNGGRVLQASTAGLGNAGVFTIDNPASANVALLAQSDALGPAVGGFNRGAGAGGAFVVESSSSEAPALYATTYGTGLAGHFDGRGYFAGSVGIGSAVSGAKLTIDNVGDDQTHGHSAVHIRSANKYFDYDGGIAVRGTGDGWATRFTSTDNMRSDGEIVGIYKSESVPGDVINFPEPPIAIFRNNGNVGIGTTDPGARLTVAGPGWLGSDPSHGHSAVYVDACNQYFDYRCGMIFRGSGVDFATKFTSTEGMNGTGEIVGIYRSESYAGQAIDGSLSVIATFHNDGKVGIGRDPTANLLEVQGNASKATAGDWLANSDRRIKTDVKPVSRALAKLDKVRLVEFRYSDEYRSLHPEIADRHYVNVVAQEFAEVFPDYVSAGGDRLPDGESILQVDSYPLTIYAAAAVQELHGQLKEKDAEIAGLKSRLAKLEAMMVRLTEQHDEGAR